MKILPEPSWFCFSFFSFLCFFFLFLRETIYNVTSELSNCICCPCLAEKKMYEVQGNQLIFCAQRQPMLYSSGHERFFVNRINQSLEVSAQRCYIFMSLCFPLPQYALYFSYSLSFLCLFCLVDYYLDLKTQKKLSLLLTFPSLFHLCLLDQGAFLLLHRCIIIGNFCGYICFI